MSEDLKNEDDLVSKCCGASMIPPEDDLEGTGSLWRAFACYICRKCGKACDEIKKEDFVMTSMDYFLEQELDPMKNQSDFDILLANCIPMPVRKKLWKEIPKDIIGLVGKKIHVHSINGTYELKTVVPNGMIITCMVWQYRKPNERERLVPFSDFKCKAGKRRNYL